jgi:hypothetical protein
MFGRQPQSRFRCDLITNRYIFSGEIDAGGSLLRHLDDDDRNAIRLVSVTANLLDPAISSMSNFSHDEMMVLKDYTVLIRLADAAAMGTRQLGTEREKLLVYTERFVIQGLFHTSPDRNRLLDIFEGPTGRWAAVSEAVLVPLIPTTKSAPVTAKLMLLNKTAIQFFHTAQA